MNQKSIEHIALYSLVLVGTLVVGVLARLFVLSKGVDDFSSSVAFFATVIVLMAIYASLQTTFNQFLLPRIEAFLLRFSAFQTMKNHNDTVSVPKALPIFQPKCIMSMLLSCESTFTGDIFCKVSPELYSTTYAHRRLRSSSLI